MILSTLCYIEDGGQILMLHRTRKENDINRDKWIGIGGRFEDGESPEDCVLREAREETGIAHVHPLSSDIYSLEILTVDGHEKRGQYVSSHLHLNLTYLLEADDSDLLVRKEDENSAVAWFSLDDAVKASTEPWFQKRIYPKLNAKLTGIGRDAGC